jgi:hypothetical protein
VTSNEIFPGKETVVRKQDADWSFHLPKGHTIQVDREAGVVHLNMPDQGTTYELGGIEETEEEVIVTVGQQMMWHGPTSVGDAVLETTGYSLPDIQEEFERIRGRWVAAGLPEQQVHAYAQGSTHEDQLAMLRRRLRAVNG